MAQKIRLEVNCVNCDETIQKISIHVTDEKDVAVSVDEFSQTEWYCEACGHTTCIGDIDTMDREDL